MRDLALVGLEVRGMVATGHLARIIPLAILAPLVSLWPYIGSPFLPAAIATLLALEPFYNNGLDLWHGQLTAGVVLPSDPARMMRLRNIGVILLTWSCASFFAALVAFVQPEPPGMKDVGAFALYLLTIQFPLLIVGNDLSWQQIRPVSRWTLEDAAAALIMTAAAGVISLPYLLIGGMPGDVMILLAYAAAMAALWWTVASRRTARTIHERYPDLWQQIHMR